MENCNEIGTIRENAAYPMFSIESSRLRTFEDWPKAIKQTAEQLADAGFFYTLISDRVVCFSCGGGIRAWEDDDDPWEQHALYFGHCSYLRLVKGYDYHDEVVVKLSREKGSKTSLETSMNSVVSSTEHSNDTSSTVAPMTDSGMCCKK